MTAKRTDINTLDVADLYNSGLTVNQIAEGFGIGINTVCRRLRDAGVTIRDRRITLPAEDIIAAFKSGVGVKTIAFNNGVSRRVIVRILGENGISPP